MKMRSIIIAIVACCSAAANAAPVTWTLDNVVFDYGGTASGSFVYDADLNEFSSMSVTSGSFSPITFEYLNTDFNPNDAGRLSLLESPPDRLTPNKMIVFGFVTDLTNAGGVIGLETLATGSNPSFAATCSDLSNNFSQVNCNVPPFDPVFVISGSVIGSPVPIPAAAWLFGSALAGLGWLRRKQNVQA